MPEDIEDQIATRGFRDVRDRVYTGHLPEAFGGQNRAILAGELQQAGLNGLDSNDFDTVPSPGGKHYRERPLAQWSRFDVLVNVNDDKTLGFMAHSAIIDNNTAQWAYMKSSRDYIPPYTIGKIIHFPMGTQKHEIIWEAPPGFTQPTTVVLTVLSLTYLEKELTPSPGSTASANASGGVGAVSPTAPSSSGSAITTVPQNAASVQLIAANPARKGLTIVNNTPANLLIAWGAGAATLTTNNTAIIPTKGLYELPPPTIFTGAIQGIWDAAGAGSANMTEQS